MLQGCCSRDPLSVTLWHRSQGTGTGTGHGNSPRVAYPPRRFQATVAWCIINAATCSKKPPEPPVSRFQSQLGNLRQSVCPRGTPLVSPVLPVLLVRAGRAGVYPPILYRQKYAACDMITVLDYHKRANGTFLIHALTHVAI